MTQNPIRIAACLLDRKDGMTLLVRKRGTQAFMQPGGKIEGTESPRAALRRELHEELGLLIDPEEPDHLGRFAAPAANEPGRVVQAEIFRMVLAGEPVAAAEIAELVWIDPATPGPLLLAPLSRALLRSLGGRARAPVTTDIVRT